jgi:uncharacterized protein
MFKQALRVVVPVISSALILGAVYFAGAGNLLTVPVAEAQGDTITQTVAAPAMPGTITVVGEGKVTLEPDIAHVTIGVETVTNTVIEASDENSAAVQAVIDALKAQGISEDDLQTSGFSIYAERFGPEGPLADTDVRYHVTNNVMVTIRELDNVGPILDAAIEAGANNIYGIDFALDDPSTVEADARSAAVEDAKTKAEELAQLNGLTLGNVVSVSEVVGSNGGYYAGNFAQQARAMGGGGTPVSPGQLDLVMQLQITYATSPAQ